MLLASKINQYTAADLRDRISLFYANVSRNEAGNSVTVFSDTPDLQLWASVRAITTTMAMATEAIKNKVLFEVAIRYGTCVNIGDVIMYQGQRLIIDTPAVDVEGRHKYIAFECRLDVLAESKQTERSYTDLRREVEDG